MAGELPLEGRGDLLVAAAEGQEVLLDELQAARLAVAMRDRISELAAGWRKRGYELGLGGGIAVGYATLGRIGFEGRYDYGALGSVTNLAARLSDEATPGQILLRAYPARKASPA